MAHGQLKQSSKIVHGAIKQGGGVFKADVSLGALPFDRSAKVKIRLTNQTNSSIEFAAVEASASYVKIGAPGGTLPIGKSMVIDAAITVPTRVSSAKQKFRVTLKPSNGTLPVIVYCDYSISGLLCFERDRFMAEFDLKGKQLPEPVRIPFIATDPIEVANVQAKGLGGLSETQCRVVSEGDQAFVECQFDWVALSRSGLAGQIQIIDPALQNSARLTCLIAASAEYDIAPRHLSLTWNATRSCYEGSAIFRLVEDGNKSGEGEAPSRLKASLLGLAGKVIVAETQTTANQPIYRIAVSIFPSARKPFDSGESIQTGRWRFEINGRTFSSPTSLTYFSE
ncbi:MAG: hypothetical protein Aurels2KO_15520 [Aureliella sp.]